MAETMTRPAEEPIPDSAIDRMARAMLPALQAFFESEEGRREYDEWLESKKQHDSEHAA